MLYSPDGRRLRRQIGFLPEYRAERDSPAPDLELVDLVSETEIESDEEEDIIQDAVGQSSRRCEQQF